MPKAISLLRKADPAPQWTLAGSLIHGGSRLRQVPKRNSSSSFFITLKNGLEPKLPKAISLLRKADPAFAVDAHKFANTRGFNVLGKRQKGTQIYEFLFYYIKIGLEPKLPKAISLLRKADPAFAVDARRLANERGFKTKTSATKKEYILFFILV